jgi:hypothetical protein
VRFRIIFSPVFTAEKELFTAEDAENAERRKREKKRMRSNSVFYHSLSGLLSASSAVNPLFDSI